MQASLPHTPSQLPFYTHRVLIYTSKHGYSEGADWLWYFKLEEENRCPVHQRQEGASTNWLQGWGFHEMVSGGRNYSITESNRPTWQCWSEKKKECSTHSRNGWIKSCLLADGPTSRHFCNIFLQLFTYWLVCAGQRVLLQWLQLGSLQKKRKGKKRKAQRQVMIKYGTAWSIMHSFYYISNCYWNMSTLIYLQSQLHLS